MTLRLNRLLEDTGIDPGEVRLLRHQTLLPDGRMPIDLWQGDIADFEAYQSYQKTAMRARFDSPYWASFVGTRDGGTMFVGIYEVGTPQPMTHDEVLASTGQVMPGGTFDHYPLTRNDRLSAYTGRLLIEWGGGSSGKRSWAQRADNQDKPIIELLREQAPEPFPGLTEMVLPMSQLKAKPPSWMEHLTLARGIYLLCSPDTGEQYVGSATGERGFWGRWITYDASGHGGNIALVDRAREDWTLSILEVASSRDADSDVLHREKLWKRKLHSRSFGLNRN